ncbi:MtnX-like HAD-IB family phosphatase [Irregularibacter muris]|uniref:MtnX-like HAD-IB family phosphatase n=1 Tax=Irregularibacter muris TaxID=1796619 RepID=A0AAE3HFB8_9FIRM|nr:MtnX-like HAD-IB family phosphatase [Irregularibacter muris]MCR1899530.1 MtnX-like HAD-IB family phosphatase [Irregularibacter muris]
MKRIYLVDFDGTITQKDTNDAMADTFAPKEWREIDDKWNRGEIPTKDAMEQILSMVAATEDELDEFFTSLPIDPGFKDFVQWVEKRRESIYIISDGIDFSIKRILKQHGLEDIPFFSNKISFSGEEIKVSVSQERLKGCTYGTCKCKVMENIKGQYPKNRQVVFIGDGYSDACVAPKTDLIFAKGVLAEYCQQENIDFHPFKDFGDILQELDK